jgi:trimeric autotransporter adhesin
MSIVANSDAAAATVDPFAVAKLLASPTEFAAKLQELEDATIAAESAVALVGPAADILRLKDEAEQDRAAAAVALGNAQHVLADAKKDAADALSSAKQKAAELIAGAESRAAALIADTQQACDEMRKQSADELADAKKKSAEAKKAVVAANNRDVEAQAAKDAATKAEFKANAVRDEFEKKLAKIKAAVGD